MLPWTFSTYSDQQHIKLMAESNEEKKPATGTDQTGTMLENGAVSGTIDATGADSGPSPGGKMQTGILMAALCVSWPGPTTFTILMHFETLR
jgi:hypothetical protein